MKTKMFMPLLLAVLVCSCGGNGSKEVELKDGTVVTQEESDGLYAPLIRGAELVSLVPGTATLEWGKDDTGPATKLLKLTAKLRLDKEPDTENYNIDENFFAQGYHLLLADINGQYIGFEGQLNEREMPLYLTPGLSLADRNTEEAKMKELLKSKPGTIAEITFVGNVREAHLDEVTEHVAVVFLQSMFPVYEKDPRKAREEYLKAQKMKDEE